MAYTQYGPPEAGDWVPQPDFAAQQDTEGGWTATQSFTIARATLDLETFQDDFRVNRPIGDLYPEIEGFWRFLGLASIPRVKHIAGDYTVISVKFAGYTGPTGQGTGDDVPEPVPTYALRGAVQERDIMLHPKLAAALRIFPALPGIIKGLLEDKYELRDVGGDDKFVNKQSDPEGNITYRELPIQPAAGDSLIFATLVAQGVMTYKFPTFLWTKTWDSTEGIKPAEVNNLGTVDAPDGDPPAIDGDRDWLLVTASQEQDGLKFRNTKEWQLSDRDGWDSDIYST